MRLGWVGEMSEGRGKRLLVQEEVATTGNISLFGTSTASIVPSFPHLAAPLIDFSIPNLLTVSVTKKQLNTLE